MVAITHYNIEIADATLWDESVRQFPGYTVFHTLPWLQTIAASHGARPVLVRAILNGECCALWPFLEIRKGPLRILGSPLPGWSTAYMGPLFRPDLSSEEVDSVVSAFMNSDPIRKHAYMACKLITRCRPMELSHFGFTHVLDLDTYRIDLTQQLGTLWENLKSECRTRIRKAEKLGLEVREETDASFISDYWRMSVETFEKSHILPTHSEQFLVEMWKHLAGGEAGATVCALSAYQNGERVATLVLPFDLHTMYYWGGASFARFRDLPAHNLLHWRAIERARQMNLREYDFISTFGGPGRFKKTFGPQTAPMAVHWERSPSRLVAALKRGYQTYLLKRRRVTSS